MCGLIMAPTHLFSEEDFDRALGSMSYRGLNIRRFHRGSHWTIGHVRLPIQNTSSGGDQPFRSSYRRELFFAFVGEIFSAASFGKTEYEYIDDVLSLKRLWERTDGFWSIVGAEGKAAFAIVDFLGIKPLYYCPEFKIVCSEIEPIMALLGRRLPLDETYLANCIKFGYDATNRTPYVGISQLEPAHTLVTTSDDVGSTISIRSFDWNKVTNALSLDSAINVAISNRMISDRPISLLMSGGLDSSIIYYTLKQWGVKFQAFTIENEEDEYVPSDVLRIPRPKEPSLKEAVKIMQEPIDLGSLLPQIQLSKAVADAGFQVCLTGDGADEVFGGYRRAKEYDSQYSDIFTELPNYHLPRLDRVMMRETVEQRSPYLSPQVIKAGLSLPYALRTEKEALKMSFKDLLPPEIIARPKHPLKSPQVVSGGVKYRAQLVEEFRNVQKDL